MYRRMSSVGCSGGLLYAVRVGQTLFSIARLFGVSIDALLDINPHVAPERLRVGQVVCVPGVAGRVCRRGRLVIVKRGDTLYSIARREGVPLGVLLEANYWLEDAGIIYPGEQACVPMIVREMCCVPLYPCGEADPDASGAALIEPGDGEGRLTMSAVGLVDPQRLGDFDSYCGSLVFREMEKLLGLHRVSEVGDERLYSGARRVDVPPLAANIMAIFPFNASTEERGEDQLRGRITECRGG